MAEQTIRKGLWEPILDQGIQNTHFFNGRLLTAGDLKTDQDANRKRHQQLGRAIGEGVVDGLEVRLVSDGTDGKSPVVSVTRGLALNRAGQAIALPLDLPDVMLVRQSQVPPEAGLFAECPREDGASPMLIGAGIYLLVISPASGFREKVPMRGLGEKGQVEGCGSRYAVEGVKFRLDELKVEDLTAISQPTHDLLNDLMNKDDPTSLSKLRNLLAYVCFGIEEQADFAQDPFQRIGSRSPYVTYGAGDALRLTGKITDADVPLALVYWATKGVQFVDMWAVRRRLVQPLVGALWPLHTGQRRLAEAEAAFLQFQNQIDDVLLAKESSASVVAKNRFCYLPPAGYLPLGPGRFNANTFFQGLDIEHTQVDIAFLRLLVHQSWFLDPIDLSAPPPLRLYEAADNPNYLLFVRQEKEVAQSPPPASEPSPGTTPSTGRINVDVDVSDAVKRSTEIANRFLPGKKFKATIDLKVWAEDKLGNEYPAKFVPSGSRLKLLAKEEIEFVQNRARFTMGALAPGSYTVHLKMTGFRVASQTKTLNAGQTIQVVFTLVPETKKPGGKGGITIPGEVGKGEWIGPKWYEKIFPIEKEIKWPWPPEEVLDFDPVTDPPPIEIQEWMQQWGDRVTQQYPEASVDPGNIRLYIDRAHTPEAISQEPYAYMVFGEGGAYMPVVLTSTDRTLDQQVPVTKGELAGVDLEVAQQLKSAGLGDLDILGASWTGLVADTMRISLETAGSLIAETREKVSGLQNSLRIFRGVDAHTETELRNRGINNAVDLANANPQDIVPGAGNSLAFAQRLVDEAQRAVPESSWSLQAEKLGLNDQEIAKLNALGITTQGTLKTTAGDLARRAGVETALGLSASELDSFVAPIDMAGFATGISSTRIGRAPTTSLVGVNRDSANALAGIGIRNIHALALANVNAVAAVLGGDEQRATTLINTARARINI